MPLNDYLGLGILVRAHLEKGSPYQVIHLIVYPVLCVARISYCVDRVEMGWVLASQI